MGILRQLPIDAQHMVNGPNTGRDMPHDTLGGVYSGVGVACLLAGKDDRVKDRLDGNVEIFPLSILLDLLECWRLDEAFSSATAQDSFVGQSGFLRHYL